MQVSLSSPYGEQDAVHRTQLKTRWLASGLVVFLAACGGESEGTTAAPPPDLVAQKIEATAVQATVDRCLPLSSGQSLRAVGPEGHAWFAVSSDEGLRLAIAKPWLKSDEVGDDGLLDSSTYAFSSINEIHARSATDATLLADGIGWIIEDLRRTQSTLPAEATSHCGNLRDGAFLLASTQVHERRGDLWWSWDPGQDPATNPSRIMAFEGECLGRDDALWASASDGTFWTIAATEARTPIRFATLQDAGATLGMLAVLTQDALWLNRPTAPAAGATSQPIGIESAWSKYSFAGNVPAKLSAAGGAVWMLGDNGLLQFKDGNFYGIQYTTQKKDSPHTVLAHAGGAWVVSDEQACHLRLAPKMRITGLSPFERRKLSDVSLTLDVQHDQENTEAPTVKAWLNGEPLPLTPTSGEAHAYSSSFSLVKDSWNDVRIAADNSERRIAVRHERISWERYIKPIYNAHCAQCHGENTGIPLHEESRWLAKKEEVCGQVVESAQMPKDPSADWTDNRIAYTSLIAQWIRDQGSECGGTQ